MLSIEKFLRTLLYDSSKGYSIGLANGRYRMPRQILRKESSLKSTNLVSFRDKKLVNQAAYDELNRPNGCNYYQQLEDYLISLGLNYIKEFVVTLRSDEEDQMFVDICKKDFGIPDDSKMLTYRKFSIDFYLVDYNLFIESDGLRPHTDNINYDRARDSIIKRLFNVDTLRVSRFGSDCNSSINFIKKLNRIIAGGKSELNPALNLDKPGIRWIKERVNFINPSYDVDGDKSKRWYFLDGDIWIKDVEYFIELSNKRGKNSDITTSSVVKKYHDLDNCSLKCWFNIHRYYEYYLEYINYSLGEKYVKSLLLK